LRELIADLFVTVDGYARGRDSPAFFGYAGPDLDAWIDEQTGRPHVMVMGANTYRVLAGMADDPASALPKIVFSRSLRAPLSWANTRLIADDVATAVPALKAEPGDPLRVIGSLSLVRSLLRLGLVDRLRLMLFPQVLGASGD
jgi:dihydrofolate reductase